MKRYFLPICVLIATVSSFLFIGSKSYWFDEAFSIMFIKQPDLFRALWVQEPSMWLYYILLRVWISLGETEFITRAFSAIFSIASIVPLYALAKKLYHDKVAFLSSVLISLNILFIFYAQDVRGYALSLFLLSLSSYFFLRSLENKKFLPLYIVLSALSFYAFNYSLFVIWAQLLYLLYLRRWKYLAICACGIGTLLLPFMLSPSLHSHVVDWLGRPQLTHILGTFILLGGDFLPLTILFIGVLFYALFRKKNNLFLLLWLFVPIIASFLISLVKPIYQSIYFLVCLPPFMMINASALLSIDRKIPRNSLIGIVLLLSVIRAYGWYAESNTITWVIKNHNEDWRGVTDFISKHHGKNDAVIFYGYYNRQPYELYGGNGSIEIASSEYNHGGGSQLPEPNTTLISHFMHPRVWLVLNNNEGELFNRTNQWLAIEKVLNNKYVLVGKHHFYDITLEEYLYNSK